MNIAIITDESGVKFINKKPTRKKTGKGIYVTASDEIIQLLKNNGFNHVPFDDLENENKYLSILHEYVKPAQELFAGRFSEINYFANTLRDNKYPNDVELFIISGTYGLIKGIEKIIPYKFYLGDKKIIEKTYRKFKIIPKISKIINSNNTTIILLPLDQLSYLFKNENNIFKDTTQRRTVIIVSSGSLSNKITNQAKQKDIDLLYLYRRGVARMGKENRNKIIEKIVTKLE